MRKTYPTGTLKTSKSRGNWTFHGLLICALSVPLAGFSLPVTFSNSNPIVINDSTNPPTIASPYASTINVTGLSGQVVTKVTIELQGLSHTFPDDIDILLVGPQGQTAEVMSSIGGGHPGASNVNLVLDDAAANPLPFSGPLVSGTFKPTKRLPNFSVVFPLPAPASYGTNTMLSVFNNSDPSGTWNLYVVDDSNPDSGIIANGWTLNLSVAVPLKVNLLDDSHVVISWQGSASNCTLQSTTNLMPPVSWQNVVETPALTAGQYMVTNSISGNHFYRLAQ